MLLDQVPTPNVCNCCILCVPNPACADVLHAEAGGFLVKQAARGAGPRPKKKKVTPAASPEGAEGNPEPVDSPNGSPRPAHSKEGAQASPGCFAALAHSPCQVEVSQSPALSYTSPGLRGRGSRDSLEWFA